WKFAFPRWKLSWTVASGKLPKRLMTRHSWWSGKYWHPTERDLLLFVNGEGGTKLARKVRTHVDGCWSCSLRRDRLAGAIAAFMRSRESALDGQELSEAAERRFASRLQRRAHQVEPQPKVSRGSGSKWFVKLLGWITSSSKSGERRLLGLPVPIALAACFLGT